MNLKETIEKLASEDTDDFDRIEHLAVILKTIAEKCGCDMNAQVSLKGQPKQNHKRKHQFPQ